MSTVNHPMTVIAHSQGTLTVTNAARYYGMATAGSTFIMQSPALSFLSASSSISSGTLNWMQPYGDVANIYAPSANPIKWMSGFKDIFCGACTHTANGLGGN